MVEIKFNNLKKNKTTYFNDLSLSKVFGKNPFSAAVGEFTDVPLSKLGVSDTDEFYEDDEFLLLSDELSSDEAYIKWKERRTKWKKLKNQQTI